MLLCALCSVMRIFFQFRYKPDVVFLQEVIPPYLNYLQKRAVSYTIIPGKIKVQLMQPLYLKTAHSFVLNAGPPKGKVYRALCLDCMQRIEKLSFWGQLHSLLGNSENCSLKSNLSRLWIAVLLIPKRLVSFKHFTYFMVWHYTLGFSELALGSCPIYLSSCDVVANVSFHFQ